MPSRRLRPLREAFDLGALASELAHVLVRELSKGTRRFHSTDLVSLAATSGASASGLPTIRSWRRILASRKKGRRGRKGSNKENHRLHRFPAASYRSVRGVLCARHRASERSRASWPTSSRFANRHSLSERSRASWLTAEVTAIQRTPADLRRRSSRAISRFRRTDSSFGRSPKLN